MGIVRPSEHRYPGSASMRVETASIVVVTNGKGTYEITDRIAAAVRRSGVTRGVVDRIRQAHQLQLDSDGKRRPDRAA